MTAFNPIKKSPTNNTSYQQTVSNIDITSVSTTPLAKLGALVFGDNADVYVYVKSLGVTAGKTVVAPTPVAALQGLAITNAASVGDLEVTLTLGATAVLANEFADGLFTDSLGNTYTIDSHRAADATDDVVIVLREALREALTTLMTADLNVYMYNGVTTTPSTPKSAVVGVGKVAIANGSYGFILKSGDINVLVDGAGVVAGAMVSPSNAVNGAVEGGVLAQGFVGTALETGTDTKYTLIKVSC